METYSSYVLVSVSPFHSILYANIKDFSFVSLSHYSHVLNVSQDCRNSNIDNLTIICQVLDQFDIMLYLIEYHLSREGSDCFFYNARSDLNLESPLAVIIAGNSLFIRANGFCYQILKNFNIFLILNLF